MSPTQKLASVVAIVVGLLSACTDENGTREDQTLVFGIPVSPRLFDPAQVRDPDAARVIGQLFETLLEYGPAGTTVEPGLARSWETSADGLSWTFRLRRDVRFHDGTPFNAQAVCANFERWYHFRGVQQSMAVSLSWRDVFGGFDTRDDPSAPEESLYRSCEVRADDEVAINLTRRSGRFLSAMAAWPFSIASPDALRRYEADKVVATPSGPEFEGTFGTEHPIGTGPFRLERFIPNDRVVLVRNEDYWGRPAKLARVIFRPIPDGAARLHALETGEVHGYDPIEPNDIETVRRAGHQVLMRQGFNVGWIIFNQMHPPLDNLKIRQAVAHSLNRDAVIKAKYPPGTLAAKEFLPPFVPGHADDVASYPYDPTRARRLIAESGVVNPKLEFWYPTDRPNAIFPDLEGIVQAFKGDLERVGFTVVARAVPAVEFSARFAAGVAAMAFAALYGPADPDWFLGTLFKEKAPPWGFDNPALFRAVNEANAELEPARREERYRQVSRMVMEFLPGVPFVHVPSAVALSTAVQGYKASPAAPVDDLSLVSLA